MSRSVSTRSRSVKRHRLQRQIPCPSGSLDARVQAVGPERFGVVAVDCANQRSRWVLRDFYGNVLLAPATVEHTRPGFRQAIDALRQAVQQHGLAHVRRATHVYRLRAFGGQSTRNALNMGGPP